MKKQIFSVLLTLCMASSIMARISLFHRELTQPARLLWRMSRLSTRK